MESKRNEVNFVDLFKCFRRTVFNFLLCRWETGLVGPLRVKDLIYKILKYPKKPFGRIFIKVSPVGQ